MIERDAAMEPGKLAVADRNPLTEGAGTTVKFLFLNLETATDRLAFMNDQFAALGMSAERIPAVAASTITTDLLVEMVHPDGEWLACKDEKIRLLNGLGRCSRLCWGGT